MPMAAYKFNELPNRAFIPVLRKRDIVKVRVLTAEEKRNIQRGSPDVVVETILGHKYLQKRDYIIDNYSYLNGQKISIGGWRAGVEYLVYREDNTPALALMVPLKSSIEINGIKVISGEGNDGVYVVCFLGGDGNIDRQSVGVVSRHIFRKMFSVLPNKIIDYHAKNKGKHVNKTISQHKKPLQTIAKENNLITAVGRLMGANGKVVGFVVQDRLGRQRNVTKKEMLELCNKKLVDNIVVAVRDIDGLTYLRGNGIKIEELKEYRV